MYIKEMFVKPIDRDLKGVIKVEQDDDQNAFQELDEYVVTKELLGHFKTFYSSYKKSINHKTDAMGVWIKGYYGSGKSHFLKILSYLLENRTVKGKQAISFFTETGKITDNFLKGDIEAAGHVPCDVILFNIDSKSAVNSKTNKDAILDVLIRVFNEHRGFCSSLPFVAELEKKLDEDGNYDAFKAAFAAAAGDEWINLRDEFFFNQDAVVDALATVGWSKESARTWCEKAQDNYAMSIEKFATELQEYCASKGKDHHVLFLIDEIGQYIGDDSKLMLNLQTVAEDLGTHCHGKVWVVVTSQEDIDNLTHVKGEDFSKIQARFDTRLSLSSANVGEVIRIRLLSKNETAKQTLMSLYQESESVLKNIITFTDKVSLPSYRSAEEFAAVYPFIPYQFDLLSYVLKAIHDHGASGKHLSEGERSMLAMFREAAISVKDSDDGTLVSFDLFYQALHTFLDHSHSSVILRAQDNDHLNEFDVKVLKTLFMIKYVKEISANIDNLTTLLIDSIDTDRVSLRKKVEASLARLIGETLVQKNGEIYIFLTNEEQDVNRAIEKMAIDSGEIRVAIQATIFDGVLSGLGKATSTKRPVQFSYNRYVDGQPFKAGQMQELSMYLVTANYETECTEGALINKSRANDHNARIIVRLAGDNEYCREIEEVLKIKKYLTQNSTKNANLSAIIASKNEEIKTREARAESLLREAIAYADIYSDGTKLTIGTENPEERIKQGLTDMVDRAYLKLGYMERVYTAKDVELALRSKRQADLGGNLPNQKALDDVKTTIRERSRASSGKTTFRALLDKFMQRPYGFERMDVAWLVATLFNEGAINLKLHGEYLACTDGTYADVERYLIKKDFEEQLILEIREKVSQKQISGVQTVIRDFFGKVPTGTDEDQLMHQFKELAQEKLGIVKESLVHYVHESALPGKEILDEARDLLEEALRESDQIQSFFFTYINDNVDTFTDLSEKLNVVMGFFEGSMKGIFEKAVSAVRTFDEHRTYLPEPELQEIIGNIRAIVEEDKWPFDKIHKLPPLTNAFGTAFSRKIEEKKQEVLAIVSADAAVVEEAFAAVDAADERERAAAAFAAICSKVSAATKFDTVTGAQYESESLRGQWMGRIRDIAKPPVAEGPVLKIKDVKLSTLVSGMNLYLEDADAIDDFTSTLKQKLIRELDGNDAIQIQR